MKSDDRWNFVLMLWVLAAGIIYVSLLLAGPSQP